MIADLIRRAIPKQFRPIGYLENLAYTRTRGQLPRGPFAGMQYITASVGSALIPKMIGIYERELTEPVEAICRRKSPLIVDIGAAEGYYAIGLARRNPQATVIAYEMEARGQAALRKMAELNGVTNRVKIHGKCEAADLTAVLDGAASPVVICDTEGYEEKLLDLQAVPVLRRSAILVELHDFIVPGITEELKKRFSATHNIEHIWQQPRTRADFPWRTLGTFLLPGSYLDWAVSEWRPVRMAWMWMEPRG